MTKRLFVGNLPYSMTENDLRDTFAEAGAVFDAKVVLDRETGRPRGFGFVEMSTEPEAQKAIELLNGRDIGGRPMTVREAEERAPRSGGGGGGRGGFGGGGGGGGGFGGDRGGGGGRRGGGGGGGFGGGGGGRGDRGDRRGGNRW